MQETTCTVLLADDHAIFTEALGALLRGHFQLKGAVANGEDLVDSARRLQPDIIVTDISMPGLDGLNAIRQLRREGCRSKFVILTMHLEPELVAEAFRAGVCGYLLKQSASRELMTAIDEICKGRLYLTPMIAKDFIGNLLQNQPAVAFPKPATAEPIHLSPRQRQVLGLGLIIYSQKATIETRNTAAMKM
jgi:DNA-binding NarL/FixJ family response regulator